MNANSRLRERRLESRRAVLPELAEQIEDRARPQHARVAERQIAHRANELLELTRRARDFGLVKRVVRTRRELVDEQRSVARAGTSRRREFPRAANCSAMPRAISSACARDVVRQRRRNDRPRENLSLVMIERRRIDANFAARSSRDHHGQLGLEIERLLGDGARPPSDVHASHDVVDASRRAPDFGRRSRRDSLFTNSGPSSRAAARAPTSRRTSRYAPIGKPCRASHAFLYRAILHDLRECADSDAPARDARRGERVDADLLDLERDDVAVPREIGGGVGVVELRGDDAIGDGARGAVRRRDRARGRCSRACARPSPSSDRAVRRRESRSSNRARSSPSASRTRSSCWRARRRCAAGARRAAARAAPGR